MKLKQAIRKFLFLFDKFLPLYSVIPLLALGTVHLFSYNITKMIFKPAEYFALYLPIDDMIPFWTPFVVIYMFAYVQWFFNYWMAARESRELITTACMADIISKVVCAVFFIFLPTALERPEITGNGFFDVLTQFVYDQDPPDGFSVNCFPSIHCLESTFSIFIVYRAKKMPRWCVPANIVFTVLVCLSTVFVKQHFFIDIVGGVLLGFLSWGIVRLTGANRVFMPRKKKDPAPTVQS